MSNYDMKPDPKVRTSPRPARVAYLIEDGVDVHGWLDAIFAECFGRDGGRQSLVVPVEAGLISKRYQDWLQVLDPDVVILLTFDNNVLTSVLTELLADTKILHWKRKRDEPEEYPRVGLRDGGLTALSWLPFLKVRSNALNTVPGLILNRYQAWRDDGFITDNFGTLFSSLEPSPLYEQIGMRGLMLTPSDAPDDRWHLPRSNQEELTDGYDIVDRLGRLGGVTTLAQLSNLNCQPHRQDHPWNKDFCLVIGDSFVDRVSCWNAGLLFDDATYQTYKTLRVPSAACGIEERVAKIGNFLRFSNWVGQSNGATRIAVRSSSLSAMEVQEFVSRLQAATNSCVEFSVIESLDDCCPSNVAGVYNAYQIGALPPVTAEAQIRETTAVVNVPKPIQLSYCSGMHPIFSKGSWLVDVDVDRLGDNSRFENVREVWQLPFRQKLTRMFHAKSAARILRSGRTSVWVHADTLALEVKQPSDNEIFHSLICGLEQFQANDTRGDSAQLPAYQSAQISDKGRYLQGLLGMFESLNNVEHVLGRHFWRSQFLKMAAPARSQHSEVITFLQRRLKARDGILRIDDDAGWQNLADRVIQQSNRLRVPRGTTRFEKLLQAWNAELNSAIDADPQLHTQRDEILSDASNSLKRGLGFLFECGVLYRGHEWSCRHCSHRNWIGVDSLNEITLCEVCRHEHHLPVDLGLDFRLNEFFGACLREHDTLTVAWALCELRKASRRCFIFAPQTMLFRVYLEKQSGKPDRELDIVCIIDGKFVIGEAKARAEFIAESDIADLAAAAIELRADVAILAAFSDDRGLLEKKVHQLSLLLPSTIEASGLYSRWDDQPSIFL